jgi:hypothetical protein
MSATVESSTAQDVETHGVKPEISDREELARELHAHTESHRAEPIPWERWHPSVQDRFLKTADQVIGSDWLAAHDAEVASRAFASARSELRDIADPSSAVSGSSA